MNYIMVSAHQEKHLKKAKNLNGIIMLNLEDGVPPNQKEIALQNTIAFLQEKSDNVVVRINDLNKRGLYEIEKLKPFNVPIRIPKVNSLDEIKHLDLKTIHLSIETKKAFFNLTSFDYNKIKAFYLGILDLFDELHLNHNLIHQNNQMVHKILIDFSLKSRYLNIKPIGFVYQKYKDLEGFEKWCKIQKDYGFEGVGCITPAQLEIANKIFIQSDKKYAKMIVERFEKEGPFTIDGLYVDEPIYKNYLQIMNNLL